MRLQDSLHLLLQFNYLKAFLPPVVSPLVIIPADIHTLLRMEADFPIFSGRKVLLTKRRILGNFLALNHQSGAIFLLDGLNLAHRVVRALDWIKRLPRHCLRNSTQLSLQAFSRLRRPRDGDARLIHRQSLDGKRCCPDRAHSEGESVAGYRSVSSAADGQGTLNPKAV